VGAVRFVDARVVEEEPQRTRIEVLLRNTGYEPSCSVPNVVQGVANAAQAAWKSRYGTVTTFSGDPKEVIAPSRGSWRRG
jgi:hypothetical protein